MNESPNSRIRFQFIRHSTERAKVWSFFGKVLELKLRWTVANIKLNENLVENNGGSQLFTGNKTCKSENKNSFYKNTNFVIDFVESTEKLSLPLQFANNDRTLAGNELVKFVMALSYRSKAAETEQQSFQITT